MAGQTEAPEEHAAVEALRDFAFARGKGWSRS